MRLHTLVFLFIGVLLLIGLLIFILSRRDGGDGEGYYGDYWTIKNKDDEPPLGIG